MPRLWRTAWILAGLLCLPVPAASAAGTYAGAGGTIVYTVGQNVWAATPDGSVRRQLTTSGTKDHATTQGSIGGNGSTLVAVNNGAIQTYRTDGSGKLLTTVLMPHQTTGGPWNWLGPLGANVSPDGTDVAYGYDLLYGPPGYGITTCAGLQGPTDVRIYDPVRYWCDYDSPRWWGATSKLVVSDSVALFLADSLSSASPVGLLPVENLGQGVQATWGAGSLAPNGASLIAEGQLANGSSTLPVVVWMPVAVISGVPVPDFTRRCFLPANGDAGHAWFSPDSKALVFADVDGVKVFGVPTGTAGDGVACTFAAGQSGGLLAPSGAVPTWSAANLAGGLGALRLGPVPRLKAAALAKGVRVTVRCTLRCAAGGVLTIPARLAGKLGIARGIVASGTVTFGPGTSALLLKAPRRVTARLARLRGVKATLAFLIVGADGSQTASSATVTIG